MADQVDTEVGAVPVTTQTSTPLFDPASFSLMQRVAGALAPAAILPDHLKAKPAYIQELGRNPSPGQIRDARAALLRLPSGPAELVRQESVALAETMGNMLLVVNAAQRWGFDPLAVAGSSYVVGGRLAYEGKLVAAVINQHAPLEGRLRYSFTGSGQTRTITVSGRFRGETEDRTVSVSVATASTSNEMWKRDPDQKLIYTGSIKWARAHWPEGVLGVVTDDDKEQIEGRGLRNVTPRGHQAIQEAVIDVEATEVPAGGLEAPSPAQQAQGVVAEEVPEIEPDPYDEGNPVYLTKVDVDKIAQAVARAGIHIDRYLSELGTKALDTWAVEVFDEDELPRWATRDELRQRAKAALRTLRALG